MAHRNNDNKLDAVMEVLIENGFESFADVLRILLNEAMKIERDQALGAGLYERTNRRRGYANGYKPKTVDKRGLDCWQKIFGYECGNGERKRIC